MRGLEARIYLIIKHKKGERRQLPIFALLKIYFQEVTWLFQFFQCAL